MRESLKIDVTVNGQAQTVRTQSDRPLLDVLREEFKLTGAKYGCGEAQCGACSVLMDGKRVFSCRTPISRAQGKTIVTIEGLGTEDKLHPVQAAFLSDGAFQCGYCTPGMIIAAAALLADNPKPSDDQIAAGMDRNLCRCCSYIKIVQAVKTAAERI